MGSNITCILVYKLRYIKKKTTQKRIKYNILEHVYNYNIMFNQTVRLRTISVQRSTKVSYKICNE